MGLVCAECRCAPEECAKDINNKDDDTVQCKNCIKPICCCCTDLHPQLLGDCNHSNNHVSFSSRSSSSSFSFFSSITRFLKYAKPNAQHSFLM
jgi:hypothetical protein